MQPVAGAAPLPRSSPCVLDLAVRSVGVAMFLEDVRVLLARGGNLPRALADAAQKDGGFSSLTLAWVLQSLPLLAARELGFDRKTLTAFREHLIEVLN